MPSKEVPVESPLRKIAIRILPRSIAAVVLVALFAVSTVGCFGRFALTRRIYDWNEHVSGDKWIRSLVFVLIVPIYGVVNLFDAFFANVVEFWSGHNPMASIPGTERWAYGLGGEAARMTLREDGAIDVLVTAPGRPAKNFSLVREINGVALLDASGVEIARAGHGPDGEPALLDSGRH
ncbi:MAG TPA: DUF3332 family protein [Myxococcota bacterium]|nr:DUF3332 family protein [Myxococcota bacterium]